VVGLHPDTMLTRFCHTAVASRRKRRQNTPRNRQQHHIFRSDWLGTTETPGNPPTVQRGVHDTVRVIQVYLGRNNRG
jgi:hypothetical protein